MDKKHIFNEKGYIKMGNIIIIVFGILVNVIMSISVNQFKLPFYFDTIGTILAGALGGFIPGIITGFLTNVLNSLDSPMDLYYGILSIVIGMLSAMYSQKNAFKSIKGWLIIATKFIAITGIAGVSITWIIYDSSIGGDSALIGNALVNMGVMPYFAQLIADLLVEIPDKLVSVGIVCLILKYLPERMLSQFSLGYIYYETNEEQDTLKVKKSISKRITCIVIIGIFLVSAFSITASILYYKKSVKKNCEEVALVTSKQAAGYVDGNMIKIFLEEGDSNLQYRETKNNLKILYENCPTVKHLYIYTIYKKDINTVFEFDNPDIKTDEKETVLTKKQRLLSYYEKYLTGEKISIKYSNTEHGDILTVFSPIWDEKSNVSAYVSVDIDMDGYYREISIFAIQVISVVFAIAMLIFTLVIWFINRHITFPIQLIVRQTEKLKTISPDKWLDSEQWKSQVIFNSDDELAKLNETVIQLEKSASINTKCLMEKEQELLQTKEIEKINSKLEIAVQKANDANAAKRDFLARMSHDMRTPMNGILGLADLSEDENNIEVLHENMKKIRNSGQYLLGLINDTLDIQKIDSGNLKLNPIVVYGEQLFTEVEYLAKELIRNKNIDFNMDTREAKLDCYIYTDLIRSKQIVVNLLSNAIKFTPDGGSILLSYKCLEKNDTHIKEKITVQDTGIGMSQDFIENGIFKPFSQEHSDVVSNNAGTGLGLSISKHLVEIMDGTIAVDSALGEGTTFTIIISYEIMDKKAIDKIEAKNNKKKVQVIESLKGKHIMLAEDHPLNAEIVRKLLTKHGCIVTWTKDGRKCVDVFKDSKINQFDAILMDIRMPNLDGIGATKEIRAMNREDANKIPIIAITANAFDEDRKQSIDAGMNAHLSKPIDPIVLFKVLSEHI